MGVKWVSALVVVAMLAGCATSGFESRKKERYGAYSALSPEFRAAVDQGVLKVGMPMDAVYIAWGKPDQVAGGETARWLYYGSYVATTTTYSGSRPSYGYTPVNYTRAQVDFKGGVVTSWRMFPQPPY